MKIFAAKTATHPLALAAKASATASPGTSSLVLALTLLIVAMQFSACKKSSSSPSTSAPSKMAGFWTYKTDVNNPNNYWNDNVLFLSNGTFRMYTALTLADTAAGPAIADTVNQVVTFGTYTVSGTVVKMNLSEFRTVGITFEGSVNSAYNNLSGSLEVTSDPNSASVLWILTRP
jgi:hypothetical protein